jgi:hypothetical protein
VPAETESPRKALVFARQRASQFPLRPYTTLQFPLHPYKLLQVAPTLYVTQEPAEKARLLKTMVSNYTITDGSVSVVLRSPFDVLARGAKTRKWWSVLLDCRTAVLEILDPGLVQMTAALSPGSAGIRGQGQSATYLRFSGAALKERSKE